MIGVDPGQTGALVEVAADGLTAIRVQRWRGARVPPAIWPLPEPGAVVAVEGLYVGPSRRGSVSLAEWTGRLLAQLDQARIVRPTAAEWRWVVLRLPRAGREVAKATAVQAAQRYSGLDPSEITPDVAEAWCLARYAWWWARDKS